MAEYLRSQVDGVVKADDDRTDLTWVHPRVLAISKDSIIWWRPAKLTATWAARKGKPTKLRIWAPPLVFMSKGRRLRVFVMEKNERPRLASRLYLTSWANTYDNGGVCLGSGRIPTTRNPDDWEDAFFASTFGSANNLRTKRYDITKVHKYYDTLAGASRQAAN